MIKILQILIAVVAMSFLVNIVKADEAADVAKQKGLVDLSPSKPETGVVFAVCIFELENGEKKLVDHRHADDMVDCLKEKRAAVQKYKTEKGEGKVTESFLFSCDKVNAEVKIEEDGTWHIIKILGRHDAAYKKKKSYE